MARGIDNGRLRAPSVGYSGAAGFAEAAVSPRAGSATLGALLSRRTHTILEHRSHVPGYRRRGWLIRRALLAADIAGLSAAFVGTEATYDLGNRGAFDAVWELALFLGALPIWILAAKLYGLYDRDEERTDHSTVDDVTGVVQMVTIGSWAVLALASTTHVAHLDFTKLLLFWLLAVLGISICRGLARMACRRHLLYIQNTLILGTGHIGQVVARKCTNHPEYGINVVGYVDAEPPHAENGHIAYLGQIERLPEVVPLLDVERVIVAAPQLEPDVLADIVRELGTVGVQVDIVPSMYEVVSPGRGIHSVEGLPLIGLPPPQLSRSSLLLKRAFDMLAAGGIMLLLAPLLPLVAAAIRLGSPGPVFFRQQRMGAGNRPFTIFKFRTMVADADARKAELAHLNHYAANGNGDEPMFKVDGDPRVTPVGRILRRYFLDELPQLFNVLRGDMSIVGPRPLVLDEDSHINAWRRRRLALKPGMTGSWQVLGRNDIGFEEMLHLDYMYVSSWSLGKDCRLLLQTLPLVLKGAGGRL